MRTSRVVDACGRVAGALVLGLAISAGALAAVTDVRVTNTVVTKPLLEPLQMSKYVTLNSGPIGSTHIYGDATHRIVVTSLIVINHSADYTSLDISAVATDGPACTGNMTYALSPNFEVTIAGNATQQFTFPSGLVFGGSTRCIQLLSSGGMSVEMDGYFR